MEESTILTPGRLAFIALANEYCNSLENARQSTPAAFVAAMTRLLPRLYMATADLSVVLDIDEAENAYIEERLDEDYYDSVRLAVEHLLGPDDVYLETFEADMKYSDTPIAASISEGLADIFQVLFNFTEMVKDAPVDAILPALSAVKEDFDGYWSQKLCNVMRPLNHLRYSMQDDDSQQEDSSDF